MVEKFEEAPIIFGDYMRVGASRSDRVYEELVDMKKVFNVLEEVSTCVHNAHSAPLVLAEWDGPKYKFIKLS